MYVRKIRFGLQKYGARLDESKKETKLSANKYLKEMLFGD